MNTSPSMTGMFQSMQATSKVSPASSMSSASRPLPACDVSNPSSPRMSATIRRIVREFARAGTPLERDKVLVELIEVLVALHQELTDDLIHASHTKSLPYPTIPTHTHRKPSFCTYRPKESLCTYRPKESLCTY